jgi:hypothetical protein
MRVERIVVSCLAGLALGAVPLRSLAAADPPKPDTAKADHAPARHPVKDGDRVIQLPEEIVRAGGVSFGMSGTTVLALPSGEAQRMAGGFADPARYLQAVPGVSNDSDFDGLLYVQGGDGGQNRILIDQVSVSDAYHFGGVVSVLNTDVIDRMELMPGGYTAEYGDALSGVLKVRRRIGNLTQVKGSAGLSLLTANGTLEGPLGNDGKGSWLVAGRRSYVDEVLKGHTGGPAALPAYWDLDARLYRRVGGNDLRLGFLRSGDFLSARLGDSFNFAPAESSGLSWDRHLTMGSLNWERAAGSWRLSQAVAYAWRNQAVSLFGGLPQHAKQDSRTFDARFDAHRPIAKGLTWVTGGQITHAHTEYGIDINRLSILEPDRRSNPRTPLDTARVVASYEGRDIYTAGYTQLEASGFDSTLSVTLGGRLEHSSRTRQTEPTPRLRITWRTPLSGVVVTGASGSYREFPGDRIEADPTIGNPNLRAERARHIVVGVARVWPTGDRLSVEGYHKRLNDLIVYDGAAPAGSPPFVNTGAGTARGLEFLARMPRRRWDAWLAYTLGEVRYRDFPTSAEYAPAQDIRHTISLVGRWRASTNWSFGLKWRAQSGRPYTPVVGRENVSEFFDGLDWIPVLGSFNSGRFPWYHRLDVRGERTFRIGGTHANAFVEVINAYGRKNLYDYRYVDGYSRAVPVRMLPLLPSFGMSVAF